MLLATTQVEDFDRFLEVFSTAGADKRKEHGSKGALSSATPPRTTACGSSSTGTQRAGRASSSDPEVPPIMKAAGHKGRPQAAAFAGRCDA